MVSRSLEKMMLIAIGLSAAVIVGVPVLLYSINILNNTTSFQAAETFAQELHSLVDTIDKTTTNETQVDIVVPQYVTVSSTGTTLTISYQIGGEAPHTWSQVYDNEIDAMSPTHLGSQLVRIQIVDEMIQIRFIPPP
jgi:hypothetical protein